MKTVNYGSVSAVVLMNSKTLLHVYCIHFKFSTVTICDRIVESRYLKIYMYQLNTGISIYIFYLSLID